MSSDAPLPTALDSTPLRFDVAHPNAPTKETTCSVCSQAIRTEYYEVEGRVVCASCRAKVDASMNGTSRGRRFSRAFGLGLLAAIAGAAVYSGFRIATGYDVGLVAILVGFIVGKAVHVGSGRRGGRRYQFLALALTYLAVSLSYVPSAVKEYRDDHKAELDSLSRVATAGRSSVPIDTALGSAGATGANATAARASAGKPIAPDSARTKTGVGGMILGLGMLVLLVLSLPVIVGFSSIISVLLLAFALMQAWRMNRRIEARITGPYRIADPPPMEAPAS